MTVATGHHEHLDRGPGRRRGRARRPRPRPTTTGSCSASASATGASSTSSAATTTSRCSAMNVYLDALDEAPRAAADGERVIAALGPKMLEVSRERAAGTHPYLVTAEPHPRGARGGRAGQARRAGAGGRARVRPRPAPGRWPAGTSSSTSCFPNYVNNWKRLGFTDDGPRRRRQRPARRRARRVGRRGRDLRAGAGAPRRRRRPRLPAGHPRRGRPARRSSGAASRAR